MTKRPTKKDKTEQPKTEVTAPVVDRLDRTIIWRHEGGDWTEFDRCYTINADMIIKNLREIYTGHVFKAAKEKPE